MKYLPFFYQAESLKPDAYSAITPLISNQLHFKCSNFIVQGGTILGNTDLNHPDQIYKLCKYKLRNQLWLWVLRDCYFHKVKRYCLLSSLFSGCFSLFYISSQLSENSTVASAVLSQIVALLGLLELHSMVYVNIYGTLCLVHKAGTGLCSFMHWHVELFILQGRQNSCWHVPGYWYFIHLFSGDWKKKENIKALKYLGQYFQCSLISMRVLVQIPPKADLETRFKYK